MPTNRQTRTRKRNGNTEVQAHYVYYLKYGKTPDQKEIPHNPFDLLGSGSVNKDMWKLISSEVMETWIKEKPGSRPWAWWEYDAPENRKRLGGIGTPSHEVLGAIMPYYRFGLLENDYTSDFDVKYYGPDFKGIVIDPKDPPQYESEAACLDRLNLLSTAEKKRIKPGQYEPVKIQE